MDKRPEYTPQFDIDISQRPPGDPNEYSPEQIALEFQKCDDEETGLHYFIHNYCEIYDKEQRAWIPFHLWPAQLDALEILRKNRRVIYLKSRQVGLTWLALCFILWHALFRSEILGLLFSVREEEAVDLLHFRVKGIYRRLPEWLKAEETLSDSKKEWAISNGSRIKSTSSGGSDSYSASMVLIDEADIIHSSGGKTFGQLLADVSPTVGESGWIIIVSRSDKSRPHSAFKSLYRAAADGRSEYKDMFIPWFAHPDRTLAFYKNEVANAMALKGSLDIVEQMYPATPEEALRSSTTGKRFPREWIQQCFAKKDPHSLQNINGNSALRRVAVEVPHDYLSIFTLPQVGEEYIITVDGGEGGQAGDDSAATVFNWHTGEECASLSGKIETTPFAEYVVSLARFYNRADIFPERNNIGKTLILHWQSNDEGWVKVLEGPDSKKSNRKYGYYQDKKSKPLMWVKTADYLRDEMLILHSLETVLQLADVDGRTLDAATEGHDGDRAITVGLYCAAKELLSKSFLLAFV